jgi:hypothetical protein
MAGRELEVVFGPEMTERKGSGRVRLSFNEFS